MQVPVYVSWGLGAGGTEYFRRCRCTKSFHTEAPFLDLSITNGLVSSNIYDKKDDIHFGICNL